jgi:hypothetical protein
MHDGHTKPNYENNANILKDPNQVVVYDCMHIASYAGRLSIYFGMLMI